MKTTGKTIMIGIMIIIIALTDYIYYLSLCLCLSVCLQDEEQQVTVGGSAPPPPPPSLLLCVCPLSGRSPTAAADHRGVCSSCHRTRSSWQKHGPWQRVSDNHMQRVDVCDPAFIYREWWTLNSVSSRAHSLCLSGVFVIQSHHRAFRGSDRQTRERNDPPGAPAALLQDARLRWKQPAGRVGAGHCYHTRTQRGEWMCVFAYTLPEQIIMYTCHFAHNY